MTPKILILCLIISQIYCVGVPLMTRKSRCMMAYTDEELETLKLDIYFPPLPNQVEGEQYQVSVTSTQTSQTTSETIFNGNYKKQISVEQNHIYRICMRILTRRDVGVQMVQYNAEVQYQQSTQSINVPQSLLKDDVTKETFLLAERMEQDLTRYKQFKDRRKETQQNQFLNVINANSSSLTLTYIEMALIIGVGVFQFFTIRNFLVQKQYL